MKTQKLPPTQAPWLPPTVVRRPRSQNVREFILNLLDRFPRTKDEIIEALKYSCFINTINCELYWLELRNQIIYCPKTRTYRRNL